MKYRIAAPMLLICTTLLIACPTPPGPQAEEVQPGSNASIEAAESEGPQTLDAFPSEIKLNQPMTGDLDVMIERGFIRALVSYSKTMYFLDGGQQRGVSYEGLKEFEAYINKKLGRKTLKLHVVIIPVPRDQIFPALKAGLGDMAAANLTITPSRQELVDFSNPLAKGVSEIVITGPGHEKIDALDDLSGQRVHVRRSSSYWDSLVRLNRDLKSRALAPIVIVEADDFLEDEDLLEMVNAGVIPATVVDSHKAELWRQVFDNITVNSQLKVREGGEIAWALRKDCPKLAGIVNEFVAKHRKGTLFGNVILKRYFKSTTWITNPADKRDRQRFDAVVDIFEKYGERYDFNSLLLTALAFQESRLDHSTRSRAGAVGIMQVLPSTAADRNVGIPNIEELEANIHAGTKYLNFIRQRYFSGPEIDDINQMFFSLAAYNAGPAKINRLRTEAGKLGLDPNKWFGNVEVVAAKRIGRETVHYVSNIAKYYVVYRQMRSKDAR